MEHKEGQLEPMGVMEHKDSRASRNQWSNGAARLKGDTGTPGTPGTQGPRAKR